MQIDTSESYGMEDLPKGVTIKFRAERDGGIVDQVIFEGTNDLEEPSEPQPEPKPAA